MVESFEKDSLEHICADRGSRIYKSSYHKKDGDFSLCWEFEDESILTFRGDVGYQHTPEDAKNKAVATFCIWIYCETVQEGKLDISFYASGRLCSHFEFHLGFTGWRTCWVPFSDMENDADCTMNEIRIQAKTSVPGKLFLDQMISCSMIDPRHHTRDFQVPFVNMAADTGVNNHWLSLYRYWNFMEQEIGKQRGEIFDHSQIGLVEERFQGYLKERYEYTSLDELEKKLLAEEIDRYQLKLTDAGILGRTVDSGCHTDAYPKEDDQVLKRLTDSVDMKNCGALMLKVACYHQQSTGEDKEWLEQSFVLFTRHILDQGWDCKSGLGTAHHLGYPMFSLYHALYLMREVLKREHLLVRVRDMIGWFSGAGRMFRPEGELDNESMDTLNTLLQGMAIWIFLGDEEEIKHTCLNALSHWLSSCMKPSPGVSGPFKADGSAFHHCSHYPAYAVGGFDGAAPMVYCLSRTKYRIGTEAHQTFKNAVLAMRLYCNRSQWLVSMSARHPVGEGPLASMVSLAPFYYLALAGEPSGGQGIDRDMGAAYLRLAEYLPENQNRKKEIYDAGMKAEGEPQGTYPFNYACALVHRKDSWMAGVRGHSRYLWSHESYEANNIFGRYITYGNLQIMGKGTPVTNRDSGYSANGWDWASWPGTTAVHLPLDRLRSDVCNVDCCSGFEEMLLSDQAFAGGTQMEHKYGVFAMKLHGHAKYDGSERAKKSWFFFGNTIVCLGGGIENSNEDYETHTTLFQNVMLDRGETWEEQKRLSLKETAWVLDPTGNGYYIPKGQELCLSLTCQESLSQNTGSTTRGDFAKAWLNHGKKPDGASYEYAVNVDADEKEMIRFSKEMQEDNPPYHVAACTEHTHILYDRDSRIFAYVFFEPCMDCQAGLIYGVDTPLLAMEQFCDGVLKLSLCDPDLRFYEGTEPDQVDAFGRQREVSLYSRSWIYNKSIVKPVKVWIKGMFCLTKGCESAVVFQQDEYTILEFSSHDGITFEFELKLEGRENANGKK